MYYDDGNRLETILDSVPNPDDDNDEIDSFACLITSLGRHGWRRVQTHLAGSEVHPTLRNDKQADLLAKPRQPLAR